MSLANPAINPIIQSYLDRGFKLIFYPAKSKGPREQGWPDKEYRPEDFKENVGVLLGTEIQPGKFLVDIDFDWTEGIPLAKHLLPDTDFAFGRPSRQVSHAFYTSTTPVVSKQFQDLQGRPIVEIRGVKTNGKPGLQTMLPPSIHPSGEQIALRVDRDIRHADDILHHCTLYAIGCLLYQHVGHRGLLHSTRLALAGFLLQSGLTEEECIRLGSAVAGLSGNDVHDIQETVRTTAERIRSGDKRISGKADLMKAIGDDGRKVVTRITEWLGKDDFKHGKDDRPNARDPENIMHALEKLDVQLKFDSFAKRAIVKHNGYRGPLQDIVRNEIWLDINKNFKFQPVAEVFDVVLGHVAYKNSFNPVLDYLNGLQWDGKCRLDQWMIRYGQAGDSPYTRAVSALVLIAAVRRIRKPGSKFDEMLVMESRQGLEKSSVLRALCPNEEWFSDDLPLNVDAKQLIERTAGKWIIEASDLSGMRSTQVEGLKAMLSRQVDGPVRMAYARLPVEIPRQFIIIGTTNAEAYLKDTTGNRRFWPVRVKKFDLPALRADRDQLWAEAAEREANGESIRLDTSLYRAAELQQERRRAPDPWEDALHAAFPVDKPHRLTPNDVWNAVGVEPRHRDARGMERILNIMQKLAFVRKSVRDDDKKVVRGWIRDKLDGEIEEIFGLPSGLPKENREREPEFPTMQDDEGAM